MKLKPVKHEQAGFASIVIALVLILVLSLITVGFAELARHEQQNSLDNQLATQAYYAAESGVNDVMKYIHDGTLTSATTNVNTDNCITVPPVINTTINTTYDVSYRCVLVKLRLPDQVYDSVNKYTSRTEVFSVTDNGGTPTSPKQFTFSWGSDDAKNTPATSGFSPTTSWNSPAVVQVSITPLNNVTRAAMQAGTFTAYMYPSAGGSTIGGCTPQANHGCVTYSPASTGPIVNGHCTSPGRYLCNVDITGLPPGVTQYMVHFVVYYDLTNVSLNDLKDASGNSLSFNDGQVLVDVTGRAKNVLKRLQERGPVKQSPNLPADAIEAGDICKRLDTAPGQTDYVNIADGVAVAGDACNLNN
jgi:Tfp pilus assembly protein PilX